MPTFDPPVFIKPTDPKGDVIVFAKAPELEISDTAAGLARFGGQWRSPSYLRAYVRAADVLVEHGARAGTLDDIALPAFYMQRHALELLVKRLLSWVYEYAEATNDPSFPTKSAAKAFKSSHNIQKLLRDLASSCQHFGFAPPPDELSSLAREFSSIEKSETWARYEMSETKDNIILHHMQEEVVLPLVQIQKRLEAVTLNTLHKLDGTEAYEDELYYAWRGATEQDA
jgi:hypothetical protein